VTLLTVDAVAERLSCARSTVYELISSGKLTGFRIGPRNGGIRVSEDDLLAYLQSCRVGAKEKPRRAPPPRLKHIKL
jgi:excisionase family DNA binding protein